MHWMKHSCKVRTWLIIRGREDWSGNRKQRKLFLMHFIAIWGSRYLTITNMPTHLTVQIILPLTVLACYGFISAFTEATNSSSMSFISYVYRETGASGHMGKFYISVTVLSQKSSYTNAFSSSVFVCWFQTPSWKLRLFLWFLSSKLKSQYYKTFVLSF